MNPLTRPRPFPPLGALLWGALELLALARSRWIVMRPHRTDTRRGA